MNPKISIAISCRNYSGYLLQALNSLENQTSDNFEFGFFDDGSTDNSSEIFGNWIRNSPLRKKCFYSKFSSNPVGVVVGRNSIFANASGDYFFSLDADDYLYPDFVEKISKTIDDNPRSHVFQILEDRLDCQTGILDTRVRFRHLRSIWDMFPLITGDNLCYSSGAFRTVGEFSLRYQEGWEDFDLYLRLVRKYDCCPTRIKGLVWRHNKVSREQSVKEDVDRQMLCARRIFQDHPETCLTGLIIYGRHIFPEFIYKGSEWIRNLRPNYRIFPRSILQRYPRHSSA